MLKTDFYRVRNLQLGEGNLSCELVFNEGHDIFGGHFPQQPVVPGVCMIQIIKELLEEHLNLRLLLKSTGPVKFLQLITPEVIPEVHIQWKPTENGYAVNAVMRKDADLFKINGLYEISE